MDNTTIREVITSTCTSCGKEFQITPAEQKFYEGKGYELPKRCPECRIRRRNTITKVCVDCNKEFTIRLNELEYYQNNGLHEPIRCPQCREFKREHNEEMAKLEEDFE